MMAKFIHASVESSSDNEHGDCVVLYFDGAASASLIRDTCKSLRKLKLPLTVDPDGEYFSYEEVATPVSELANLRRYEVSPAE